MSIFQNFIKRQILGLVKRNEFVAVNKETIKSNRKFSNIRQKNNVFWSQHKRDKKIKSIQDKKASKNIQNYKKKSKSAFYRELLKDEQILNVHDELVKKIKQGNNDRVETYTSTSTRRRLCFELSSPKKLNQDEPNIKLIKRQSSCISDRYLKSKLNFSQKILPSNYNILKLSKM